MFWCQIFEDFVRVGVCSMDCEMKKYMKFTGMIRDGDV